MGYLLQALTALARYYTGFAFPATNSTEVSSNPGCFNMLPTGSKDGVISPYRRVNEPKQHTPPWANRPALGDACDLLFRLHRPRN